MGIGRSSSGLAVPGASARGRRRGDAGRARGREPRVGRLRAARRSGRGGLAARGRRGGDRDGARLGPGADRRRGGKRRRARLDTRDGRADRGGARGRRGARDRRGRRLGDDRRRARSGRGAARAVPRARPGRLRRADAVPRRRGRLRSPEGRGSRARSRRCRSGWPRLAARYRAEYGVEVCALPGSGAAGGLAGGLAALGAELVPGFALVAEEVGLGRALDGVALVITGEGKLDATSFAGKVVGGVLLSACRALVVAGEIEPGTECPATGVLARRALRFRARVGRPRGVHRRGGRGRARTGRESASPS